MFKRKSSGLEHDYELKSYMNKRLKSQDPKVSQPTVKMVESWQENYPTIHTHSVSIICVVVKWWHCFKLSKTAK